MYYSTFISPGNILLHMKHTIILKIILVALSASNTELILSGLNTFVVISHQPVS